MDWRRIYPNEMLDLLDREKPSVFASYTIGLVYLNTILSGRPRRLLDIINSNSYIIWRTGKQKFMTLNVKGLASNLSVTENMTPRDT